MAALVSVQKLQFKSQQKEINLTNKIWQTGVGRGGEVRQAFYRLFSMAFIDSLLVFPPLPLDLLSPFFILRPFSDTVQIWVLFALTLQCSRKKKKRKKYCVTFFYYYFLHFLFWGGEKKMIFCLLGSSSSHFFNQEFDSGAFFIFERSNLNDDESLFFSFSSCSSPSYPQFSLSVFLFHSCLTGFLLLSRPFQYFHFICSFSLTFHGL